MTQRTNRKRLKRIPALRHRHASVRPFEPVRPEHVSIYHCGLTVQSGPHLGHIRKEAVFDVLRRWLTWSGYEVTVIANITDIDDKI